MAKKAIPLPIVIEEEKKEEDCPKCPPVGAPAWMATFADMATLLMAFFVLILSFAEFSKPKFKMIAGSLKNSFGVQRVLPVVEQPRGTTMLDLKFSPSPQPSVTEEMKQDTTATELRRIEVKTKEEGQEGRKRELAEALVSALESGKVTATVRQNEVVLEFSSNQPGQPDNQSAEQARTEDKDTSKSAQKTNGQGSPGAANGNDGDEGSTENKGEQAERFQQLADLIEATQAMAEEKRAPSESRFEDDVAIKAEDSSARNASTLTEFDLTAGPNQGEARGGSDVGVSQGGRDQGTAKGGLSEENDAGGRADQREVGGIAQNDQTGGSRDSLVFGGPNSESDQGAASDANNAGGQNEADTEQGNSKKQANQIAGIAEDALSTEDREALRKLREEERQKAEATVKAMITETKLRVALREVVSQGLVAVEQREDKVFITVGAGGAFPSGSADLTQQAEEIVQRIAFGAMDETSSITVTGHTDNVPIAPGGLYRDNWDLAAARSASIVRAIEGSNLIDVSRLKAISKGETAPRSTNDSASGREENRRIEIEISY